MMRLLSCRGQSSFDDMCNDEIGNGVLQPAIYTFVPVWFMVKEIDSLQFRCQNTTVWCRKEEYLLRGEFIIFVFSIWRVMVCLVSGYKGSSVKICVTEEFRDVTFKLPYEFMASSLEGPL